MQRVVGQDGVADRRNVAERFRVPVPGNIGRGFATYVAGHLQLTADLTQGLQAQPALEEGLLWKTGAGKTLVTQTIVMLFNRDLFRRTVLQKCGRDINCSLGCDSYVKNSIIPQSKPK